MKVKYKILTVNILVVFVAILTALTGVFSVLMKMFSTNDKNYTTISVAAESTMTFEKTGLLDLVGKGAEVSISNPIDISSKEKAIELFNNYVENYFNTGKVKAISSTLVTGGGEFMGMSAVYYGIFNEEMYYEDGVYYSDNVYCKIPNANGEDDGQYAPDNFIEHVTIKDGIETKLFVSGGKDVCYYIRENGGYKIIKSRNDFTTEETKENKSSNLLFPFEVNENTVYGLEIDNSSSFIVKVKFFIKDSALNEYKIKIKEADDRNKGVPTFTAFNFEVSFNKYTGEIIEITKYEAYVLPSTIEVSMTRSTNLIFKKED